MEKNELAAISLTQLLKKGMITAISELRENTNGYPFVTFLKGSKANNVYFGVKTAEVIKGTFEKGDTILSFLKDCSVAKTENANGETRFKLFHSTSSYASESQLMAEFGLDSIATNFPIEEFAKEFTAKENVQIPTP